MKKGFTLVELLGVVVVLGLLIVITATNGFGIFNKVKDSINTIEEDNLLEAARVFLVDVDNDLCSPALETDLGTTCSSLRNSCRVETGTDVGNACMVTVKILEKYDYFDDKSGKCDGDKELKIKIITDTADNTIGYEAVKANSSDIICSN